MKRRAKSSHLPLVIAHRGFSARHPENTIAAIDAALVLGVDLVEIDVHETHDGRVVVFHDYRLDRLCHRQGRVRDCSLASLQRLKPDVPLLDEVLLHCRGRAEVLLEIKRADPQKVVDMIHRCGMRERTIVLSGSTRMLSAVAAIDPKIRRFGLVRSKLRESIARFAKSKVVQGVAVDKKLITSRKTVASVHQKRWRLFVWTVNRQVDMERLSQLGVDGLITNHPDRGREIPKA